MTEAWAIATILAYVATLPLAWLVAGYLDARLDDDALQRSPFWFAWPVAIVFVPLAAALAALGTVLRDANRWVRARGEAHRRAVRARAQETGGAAERAQEPPR